MELGGIALRPRLPAAQTARDISDSRHLTAVTITLGKAGNSSSASSCCCVCGLTNGRCRRVLPIAPRPREGLLTEPTVGAQRWPWERVLMPPYPTFALMASDGSRGRIPNASPRRGGAPQPCPLTQDGTLRGSIRRPSAGRDPRPPWTPVFAGVTVSPAQNGGGPTISQPCLSATAPNSCWFIGSTGRSTISSNSFPALPGV